jgi:hypothetical protein
MSSRLVAKLTTKLQEELKVLPEGPADLLDYELWGRKFVDLWVSGSHGSPIDRPIHSIA